jgi:glutamine amidotransferase
MSNLRSVAKACGDWGVEVKVSGEARDLAKAEKLILPGVGAFGDAMRELEKRCLVGPICDWARAGKPFLGICLGLQLLFKSSEESPGVRGLGLLSGKVVRFPHQEGCKVPHMGWNQICIKKEHCPLLGGVPDGAFVYYVHSYYVMPEAPDVILAETHYSRIFTSMVWQANVYGTQFHPEKSQETGLRILENFVRL